MAEKQQFNFVDTEATKKLFGLKKRIKAVCGGTSASKTISILVWIIDYSQTSKEKKVDVMSESYPHLEDGAIKDFKSIMIDRGYWKDVCWNETKHKYTFETGTVLKFISIDKLGKAHGPRRDVLFINEANNIPYQIYEQLEVRTKEHIWLDWNPSIEFWYYTQIKGRVDHDFITLTYLDCKNALDDRIIESIESRRWNVNWWKVYGLGQLGDVEGRIYTGWQIIDEIPHEARHERNGLDFGYSVDPSVIERIYRYNGGFIIDEGLYQKGVSNKGLADIIIADGNVLTIGDGSEPKSVDEIASYGASILGAVKGPGSVKQGINVVQFQKISVTKRSLKTITAYRNYMWARDRQSGNFLQDPDDTVHEWSNPMDAIRYGITHLVKPSDYKINPNNILDVIQDTKRAKISLK